jgi:hypothetical protein
LSKFGEEGNLIVVGVKDDRFYSKNFCCLDQINERVKSAKEVDLIVSINDLKIRKKRFPTKI